MPVIGQAADTAEKAPVKPATPTLGDVLGASGIDFSGYIDATYTNLSSSGKFIGGVLNNRVFDFEPNSFNLQAIDLTVSKLPAEGFGGLVDLTLGKDADTIAAYGAIDSTKGPANGVNKHFDVTQVYFQYATGPFTLIAGKYVTLAGAEVIKSPSNTNLSRSILFGYAIPFTHTGVRGIYKINDMVSLTAGVNNGWDDMKDTNKQKTMELGVSLTPTKSFSLSAQGYSGMEQITNYPLSTTQGTRNLIDLVATYNATDQLTFILNYDIASQKNATLINGKTGTAKWDGWAGYVNYQFNDKWRLSLRGEIFNDKDGYRTVVAPGKTVGQKWKEATLTLAYMPTKNVELRGEVRGDRSDQLVFLQSNSSAKKTQQSFGLEAIYKF
jgi:hypothetical protein